MTQAGPWIEEVAERVDVDHIQQRIVMAAITSPATAGCLSVTKRKRS
jgi:hypothetical protein